MKRIIAISFFALTLMVGCSDDEITISHEDLLGTWITLDKSDTLQFTSEIDFYKSSKTMSYDHYSYQLLKDSLQIGYSGKMFVLVYPTKHQFNIDKDELMIDFSQVECFGFDSEKITYLKED
ncbi:MAG: hypothetical protein CMO01_22480 [Thalassobius sp.]|nr:hypothetical protein [Thalassovita sp.]